VPITITNTTSTNIIMDDVTQLPAIVRAFLNWLAAHDSGNHEEKIWVLQKSFQEIEAPYFAHGTVYFAARTVVATIRDGDMHDLFLYGLEDWKDTASVAELANVSEYVDAWAPAVLLELQIPVLPWMECIDDGIERLVERMTEYPDEIEYVFAYVKVNYYKLAMANINAISISSAACIAA